MKQIHLVKVATLILLSFGSLGAVGGGLYLTQIFSNNTEQIITDSSRYQQIRRQWSNNTQINHFPTEIPSDAKNVRIVYSPGVVPDGSFFQLRMQLPSAKIQKLRQTYQHNSQYQYRGGNTNDHSNQENGVPTTFFYTGDVQQESFPPSYEILVLGANDRGNKNFKWNHGDSYGVAIDSFSSEIVYWAEQW